MKKLGLCTIALAGVMAFTGCSCFKNGEYAFHSVEVKDGDETKTYTCEKGEERITAGDVACSAAALLPIKYNLDGDKLTITTKGLTGNISKEYDAKIEDKKLYYKLGDNWVEVGQVKGRKILVGNDDYTVIYKK